MVTVRTCTDLGTIPNTARNEFSTSYTMYIVCLLLLLWLQSGRARTWEPSQTRLITSSPPATLCTLFVYCCCYDYSQDVHGPGNHPKHSSYQVLHQLHYVHCLFIVVAMVTVRTCTDLGTIRNTARNEFSTSYTMYIVCLLLLLWLQSGCAQTREPSQTRLVTSSPPATLCTLFVYCCWYDYSQDVHRPGNHPQHGS